MRILRADLRGWAEHLEPFDELRKVGKTAGQPVDLVDHHLLGETSIDVGEQALQLASASP